MNTKRYTSGLDNGEIVILPEQVERMALDAGISYENAYAYVLAHETSHTKYSDGYVIITFALRGKNKKNMDVLNRYFAFMLEDEIRVMQNAKQVPYSKELDAGNLRGIKYAKMKCIEALTTGIVLRVRGKESEKGMSLRDILRRRRKIK